MLKRNPELFVSAHSWFACYGRYFAWKLLLELLFWIRELFICAWPRLPRLRISDYVLDCLLGLSLIHGIEPHLSLNFHLSCPIWIPRLCWLLCVLWPWCNTVHTAQLKECGRQSIYLLGPVSEEFKYDYGGRWMQHTLRFKFKIN